MATAFNLKDYACQHGELPQALWRVTHCNSQHELYPATGDIWAKDLRPISDEATLKEAASNHFDWYSGIPSRFLSVFMDKKHADNWAKYHRCRGDREVHITRIVTGMLPADTLVFDATKLSERLEIPHGYSKDELIFLHRIPWQCLGRPRKLDSAPHDNYKDDSAPALVQSLQNLHDTVGPFIGNSRFPYRLINIRTGNPIEVLAKDYHAAMKDVVVAMAETLREKHEHSHKDDSCTTNPFIKLSMMLCKSQKEEEDLLLKVADCASPSAPSTLPQSKLKTPTEVRQERAMQKAKAESQLPVRPVNVLPARTVKAPGTLTPQDHTAQQSMQSERLEGGSGPVDSSTPVVEPVTRVGRSFLYEHELSAENGPEAEGSGEIATGIDAREGTEAAILAISGMTLLEG